ncbi:insulin-like [Limulus polyphemus]|uniref:Insulin-like n=1 Tax=Limulus polyphemus TaxID=6850 RepID=A0ABM1BML3_LIMPO|nr:insulin-like [Limulus polyphemus]
MRMNILLLNICVYAAVTSLVMSLPSQHLIQTRSQKLCGSELAQALSIVCGGFYYPPPHKRPDRELFDNELNTVPWWRLMKDLQIPSDVGYLDGHIATSLFHKRDSLSRQTRGVSDECCAKSCTINELMSYCGSAGKK